MAANTGKCYLIGGAGASNDGALARNGKKIEMMRSLTQSPTDPEFVQDPYPFYDEARKSGDLFHWSDYDRICAVSFRSANALLRDRRWGRERPPEFRADAPDHLEPFMALERNSMLELDPPKHTRLRGLVSKALTSRQVAEQLPAIASLAEKLATGLADHEFEIQKHFAEKLPVLVIAGLLGVPAEMADQLLEWSHRMVAMYQAGRNRRAEDRAAEAAAEFSEYIRREIENRRVAPKDDLISSLIAAEEGGQRLTADEMASTCILLLNAGHEATANSIGNAIKAIIESGISSRKLFSDGAVGRTVEETLRYDPPLHMFERHAKQDMEFFGSEFKRGDTVAVLLGGANRDPAAYPNPDRFNPGREAAGHISFGAGIHFCVGAPLARAEIAVGLSKFFDRFPNPTFAETPKYADRYHFRGLEALKLLP